MKNTASKIYAVIGSAVLMLVLSFVVAAFPAQAHANYGGGYTTYGSNYSCPHPYVYPNGYYYCGTQATVPVPPPQQYPTYPTYPVYPTYPSLTATCYASASSAQTGGSIQWTAYASGGTGSYSYTWSGTDNLYGSGQTVYMGYYTSGYKTASVLVYSGAQSINVSCGSVNVYDNSYYYQQPTYNYSNSYTNYQAYPTYASSNSSGLEVGCYSDPKSASVNQPVTWNVEVTGGAAPYTYSWTGSDGLTGSAATVIKYYQSSGTKSAIVSVTSADGKSTTWSCSNTVAVKSAYAAPKAPVKTAPVVAPAQTDSNLGASAFFSLNNIPWGWVAVLIILVLFATVMYLVFNKTKI